MFYVVDVSSHHRQLKYQIPLILWEKIKKIKTEVPLIYGSFIDQRQEMGQNAVRLAALITSVGVQGDDLSAIAAF